MALAVGTQLGTIEITGLLGRGGMGEVYRALDLKLKREVAVKILPDEFLRDADRVSRFQRERLVCGCERHRVDVGLLERLLQYPADGVVVVDEPDGVIHGIVPGVGRCYPVARGGRAAAAPRTWCGRGRS
jgi:hypothetical protein